MRLLTLALGTLIGAGAGAQPEWRLSNPLGTDRGPAPQGATSGWLLRVDQGTHREEQALFHEGREQWVRILDRDSDGRTARIQELRGGGAVWDVVYDPETGLPSTETSFEDGRPTETAHLEFRNGILAKRTVFADPKTWLYTDTLAWWPDGTLRRVSRNGPQGPVAQAAWAYSAQGALAESWVVDEDNQARGEHRETLYEAGRTQETLAAGTKVLVTRVAEEVGAGSRETETDTAAQQVDQRVLDSAGRITSEVRSVKGAVVQTRLWSYDARGRVTEEATESAGPREVWTYEYLDDGTVSGRLTRGGTVVREEVRKDGVKLFVRLFDRGKLFLVETWSGGRLSKESFYQDGAVVRERTP